MAEPKNTQQTNKPVIKRQQTNTKKKEIPPNSNQDRFFSFPSFNPVFEEIYPDTATQTKQINNFFDLPQPAQTVIIIQNRTTAPLTINNMDNKNAEKYLWEDFLTVPFNNFISLEMEDVMGMMKGTLALFDKEFVNIETKLLKILMANKINKINETKSNEIPTPNKNLRNNTVYKRDLSSSVHLRLRWGWMPNYNSLNIENCGKVSERINKPSLFYKTTEVLDSMENFYKRDDSKFSYLTPWKYFKILGVNQDSLQSEGGSLFKIDIMEMTYNFLNNIYVYRSKGKQELSGKMLINNNPLYPKTLLGKVQRIMQESLSENVSDEGIDVEFKINRFNWSDELNGAAKAYKEIIKSTGIKDENTYDIPVIIEKKKNVARYKTFKIPLQFQRISNKKINVNGKKVLPKPSWTTFKNMLDSITQKVSTLYYDKVNDEIYFEGLIPKKVNFSNLQGFSYTYRINMKKNSKGNKTILEITFGYFHNEYKFNMLLLKLYKKYGKVRVDQKIKTKPVIRTYTVNYSSNSIVESFSADPLNIYFPLEQIKCKEIDGKIHFYYYEKNLKQIEKNKSKSKVNKKDIMVDYNVNANVVENLKSSTGFIAVDNVERNNGPSDLMNLASDSLSMWLIKGTLKIPGDPFYIIDKKVGLCTQLSPTGYLIRIKVLKSNGELSYLSGDYRVSKVKHSIDDGNYTMDIDVWKQIYPTNFLTE